VQLFDEDTGIEMLQTLCSRQAPIPKDEVRKDSRTTQRSMNGPADGYGRSFIDHLVMDQYWAMVFFVLKKVS